MPIKPVINIDDVDLTEHAHGERFAARLGPLGSRVGAEQIGCRLTEVPPGKRAWPFHCHHANEEMFFILEGHGTYRYGNDSFPLRAGDLVAAPAGGPETAHQIINDSDAPLRYLAWSTMREPDVTEYPDSGKFGVFAGAAPGGDKARRNFAMFGRNDSGVGYWDGED